jgi:pectinesterase
VTINYTVNPGSPLTATNFHTIQSAVDAVPLGNLNPTKISISPGTYDERVLVPAGKEYVTLLGSGGSNSDVVLTANDWMGGANGWEGSQALRAYANNFQAKNLTIQNTWGDNGYAMALRAEGDKQIYDNVQILGWQDTLYISGSGRQYYVNSTVKGRTDFIWGGGNAILDNANVVSRVRGNNGGYITAANTDPAQQYGFIIKNSTLSAETDDGSSLVGNTYLGRTWGAYAQVAYLNNTMGAHVRPVGWHNFNNPANEATARYYEYNSAGPGGNTAGRASWATVLTSAQQASMFDTLTVFRGWDPLNTPLVPVIWTGGASNNQWNSAGNWDSGAAPMLGQNLYINPATTANVTVSSTAFGDQLTVGRLGTPSNLTIATSGNLQVSGFMLVQGGSTVTIDGGTLSASTISIPEVGNSNAVVIKNNGVLNVDLWTGGWGPCGALIINRGTFASKGMGGAEIKMAPNIGDAATINIRPGDAWPGVRSIATGNGVSVINQTGGVINGVYGPYLGDSGSGTATYNISGGTAFWLDPVIGRTYSGSFTVNQSGGTINAVGATGTQYSYNDGIILIGDASGAVAEWDVSGTASLNHRAMHVGGNGSGIVRQTGGTVTIDQPNTASTRGRGLKIGVGSSVDGRGLYQISGGTLTIKNGGLALGYNFSPSGNGVTPAQARGTFSVVGGRPTIDITGNYDHRTGSILAAQLDGTGLSTIDIDGNVWFRSNAVLDLSYVLGASDGTYVLMTWTGTLTGTPVLSTSTDTSHFSFVLDSVNKRLLVAATAVPEPGASAVALVTFPVCLRRRTSRKAPH